MSETTPGQAFRDKLRELWIARGRCVDMRDYDALPQEDRDDLEAAAWAAVGIALPGVDAALGAAERLRLERDQARGQLAALRELLDEIGVMAANAPEDGDSFGLLEELAMRIAAFGTVDEPDDGRHPDGCACQFCREDEREERAREELDDDTDNAIPDTEGGAW